MSEIILTEEVSVDTPMAGTWKLYAKADGWYAKDDAGNEIGPFGSSTPQSNTPGGRLTLTTGVPVTTADVTGATTIYYTPYTHNTITLWNGVAWQTITFAEVSHALGTMTAGRGYDLFAYLNAGALAIEKLVWTSAAARATNISLQDGRYCKMGDKTRLYLGSFYSVNTTTTEDSVLRRFLFNYYHKKPRMFNVGNASTHTYNVAVVRPFNNDQANSDVEIFVGLVEEPVQVTGIGQFVRNAADGAPRLAYGVNSTTVETFVFTAVTALTGRIKSGASLPFVPTLGYSYIVGLEFTTVGTAPGTSYESVQLAGMIMA